MLRILLHLYLLSTVRIIFVCSHHFTHVETELQDLVTQQSVIERVGMVEVIRDFRDGNIVTVEWPTLVDIVCKLDRASEELLLTYFANSVPILIDEGDMNCGCIAQPRAAQTVQEAMNQVNNARDRLTLLVKEKEGG
ncbi:uncharacterized protein N7529_009483 [Penicillium soppii]|uniref:uncharacterized protein n=1 Tax=Penicillium soppii TaxID=69789 RepID=UPI002547D5DC|nr:uncharacterized protein N7529_009483 [Penicillium soppii]KAJ5855539.1 hypothetical protein N7529_009483 [Penicillium soppii]